MSKRIYITDKEVAKILEMSPKTISRIMSGYVRGGERRMSYATINRRLIDAKPESFGGYRRWKVCNLARVLGISESRLLERIS